MGRSQRRSDASTIVVVGSVVRHWTRSIEAHPRGVVVLSPFVTSSTAETVLRNVGEHSARIYTVFESHLFASGASQISTLRHLAELGHRIFHVPRLHAKVIVTKKTATVGSQNLTGGGQFNREASVVLRDRRHVGLLRTELQRWLRTAERVTLERIVEMERSIDPLRRAFRKFKEAAEGVDVEVAKRARQQRKAAVEEARRLAEKAERQAAEQERLRRLRAVLERSERSTWSVGVRLIYDPYVTLMVRTPKLDDLRAWVMPDGERVWLDKRDRYLLVSPMGRLAWVAINKTRFTQFGSRLTNDTFEFNGRTIRLSFSATATPRDGDANVQLDVRVHEADAPVTLTAWFDLERVELREVRTPENRPSVGASWIGEQVETRRDELMAALAARILRSFRYRSNSFGEKATEFLGTGRTYFRVTLRRRGALHFLALE